MKRLTRRGVLLGGLAGAAAAAGFGFWGRFALGDSFEGHVAGTLGLDSKLTNQLLARMRKELDDYEFRAAAFLVATEGPSQPALPDSLREEAVNAFVDPMFRVSGAIVMPLAYAGLRHSAEYRPCKVLTR